MEKSYFDHIEIRDVYPPEHSYDTIFQKLPELVINELSLKPLIEQLKCFRYVRMEGCCEIERDYIWAEKENPHAKKIKLSMDKIQNIVVFHGIIVQINKWKLGEIYKCGMYEKEELVMYADSQYRELRPAIVERYQYYEWIELNKKYFMGKEMIR